MLTQSINAIITQKTEQNVCGLYVGCIIYIGAKTQPTIPATIARYCWSAWQDLMLAQHLTACLWIKLAVIMYHSPATSIIQDKRSSPSLFLLILGRDIGYIVTPALTATKYIFDHASGHCVGSTMPFQTNDYCYSLNWWHCRAKLLKALWNLMQSYTHSCSYMHHANVHATVQDHT